MEAVGVTVLTPEVGTSPMPSIETVVASVVRHVSTTWSPAEIVAGVAVICAVGAALRRWARFRSAWAEPAFFLWQPATVNRASNATTGTKMRLNCFKSNSFAGSKR